MYKIEYYHNSFEGISIGVASDGQAIHIAYAFTNQSAGDCFSRAKGRKIISSRISEAMRLTVVGLTSPVVLTIPNTNHMTPRDIMSRFFQKLDEQDVFTDEFQSHIVPKRRNELIDTLDEIFMDIIDKEGIHAS